MRNNPIKDWANEIKKRQQEKEKVKNDEEPVSTWKDKIRINNDIHDCINIILRTKGCSWAKKGGCSMCGYLFDASSSVTQKQIFSQLKKSIKQHDVDNKFYVKIFTSGSFLDNEEITREMRLKIVEELKEKNDFAGLSIESRPEYINKKTITELKNKIDDLIVGVGLETSNNEVRKECINKGFSLNDYKKSIDILKKNEAIPKTYLLLKPPFLSEEKAIKDTIISTKKVSKIGSDKISINPCNIQRGTIVNELYKNNEYNPPWLWSLIQVLKETKEVKSDVISHPVAAGKKRGIHNCGECDGKIIEKIKNYSLYQDPSYLNKIKCGCKEQWKTILKNEEKSHNFIT